jgi:hypothetical protein
MKPCERLSRRKIAMMTRDELVAAAAEIVDEHRLPDMSQDELERLITVTQYVTDLCINEFEARGEIIDLGIGPLIPYVCEYYVDTILTRPGH